MNGVRLFLVFGSPIFAALVLIYLLLPGTLVSADKVETHSNRALEERLARIREVIATNVCEAPAQPPTIVTPEEEVNADRVFRPVLVDPETAKVPAEVTSQRSKNDGDGDGVADPNDAVATSDAVDSDGQSLADLIRKGTVLILAIGDENGGIGTGFVVDDRHIITNFHVVDGATKLIATSRESGRPIKLELIEAVEGDVVGGTADLALLRATETLNLARLPMASFPDIMDGVFAAGYPGFVVATDKDFQNLVAGDVGSAPSIVITQGRISAIQNQDSPTPLLVHSAEISQGNSGGPLIDECGRVVGINTFGRTDKENAANRTVFYAQPSRTALDAFADAGAKFQIIEGYCGTVTKKDVSPPSPDEETSE